MSAVVRYVSAMQIVEPKASNTIVPKASNKVEIHGARIAYQEQGTGPPVLLIHGLGASSVFWKATLPALAARHRVIAPDLPGFGESSRPAVAYSPGIYPPYLVGLLDRLGIPRAAVVGHSMGGLIALRLCRDHPDRVERLALLSSTGMPWPDPPILERVGRLPGIGELILGLRSAWATRWVLRRYAVRQPSALTADVLAAMGQASPQAFLQLARTIRGEDVRPWLGTLRLPVLIVWGDRDRVVPLDHGRAMAALIPAAKFVAIPEAGHFVQLEQPEAVNAVLTEFLASWSLSE